MAHFESDAEVYDQLGGILNNLVYNAERRALLLQADAVVQFAFRDPNATVTLDVRANKTPRVELGQSRLRADVVLSMDADTGRALLTGELSPTIALARGDVRTKGPVAKVLRLVPATVGASEVEADLEPEPEPAPQAEAAPAPQAEAATPPAEEPTGPEAAEESAAVDPPIEAEEAAPAPPAAEEPPAEALHAEEPAPAEEPEAPAPPAEEPTGPEAAEESLPVDPPVEAETPPEDQAS